MEPVSPVENTVMMSMMKDFNDMVSSRNRDLPLISKTLDFDTSHASYGRHSQSGSVTMRSLLEKERNEREKETALIAAQAKIANLQNKMSSIETSRKRARIDFESEIESVKLERMREQSKLEEMKNQLTYTVQCEKDVRDQLEDTRRKMDAIKSEYGEKNKNLQKELFNLQTEYMEFQETSRVQMLELKNDKLRGHTEMEICKNELQETKMQLKLQIRKNTELNSQIHELEDYRTKLVEAEQRIKDLESEISKMEDDAALVKVMKAKLLSYPEIEAENNKLRSENCILMEKRHNVLLLQEQNESLQQKVVRSEEQCVDFSRFQVENEDLRKRIAKWEAEDLSGVRRPQSPTQLSRRLADLQQEHAILLEKQGQLQARTHSAEVAKKQAEDRLQIVTQRLKVEEKNTAQREEVFRKLRRKLLLLSKEREGYQRTISAYESELTVNVTSQSQARIRMLEEAAQGYRNYNDELEEELSTVMEQLHVQRAKNLQLDQKLLEGGSTPDQQAPNIPETDQKLILQLREKIADLEDCLERRALQGDFDPTKTKVLHFTMNPAAKSQQERAKMLEKLKEENTQLKQRTKYLEGMAGVDETDGGPSTSVDDGAVPSTSTASTKEVEELKDQLTSAELKNKRLKEVFTKTSQEFREVCYQLMGFKIDILPNKRYRLMSLYAESVDDFLVFQQTKKGEMQLLDSTYSQSLSEMCNQYLMQHDSIPAFLSALTMDLFGRQTMMIS